MSGLAILYSPDEFSLKKKIMGRQSASIAFLQAVADAQPKELWCYTHGLDGARRCAQQIAELGSPRTGVRFVPMDQPEKISPAGLLYRGDPVIGPHAWHRTLRANPRAYSICGITHTISSHGPMTAFADYLTAPVEAWDALICTSRAAKDAVRYILEAQANHLASRTGATHFSLPQLPVIPLGVHTAQFKPTRDGRAAARRRLGLSDDEVAVLFAGRLIVHGKAHPVPMYVALEQAAAGRKVVLIQAGRAPNDDTLKIFSDEPRRLCPSVRNIMVDGADFDLYRAAWAAADIFTSLSDNIQETFGLTPIEAMAAGLPVVVSDWDGYKDTVRDGIDGFRIPTLSLASGMGADLAVRYDLGTDNFDYYSGYASQFVAVEVEAATLAYRRLIEDADLRMRMGSAGAQHAREQFEWSAIFRRYQALWEELAERRRSDPQLKAEQPRTFRPDRSDPFSMFASYPTHQIGPGMAFRRRVGLGLNDVDSLINLSSVSFARSILPNHDVLKHLLTKIDPNWISFDEIIRSSKVNDSAEISKALVWLSKMGFLLFSKSQSMSSDV